MRLSDPPIWAGRCLPGDPVRDVLGDHSMKWNLMRWKGRAAEFSTALGSWLARSWQESMSLEHVSKSWAMFFFNQWVRTQRWVTA